MWDLGNRGVFVLISVLSGCVFVYNAWGPILTLAVSLLLVVYACYSLLVYDSILSPQTILVLKYLKEAGRELHEALRYAGIYFVRKVRELSHVLKNLYHSRFVLKMSRYRKSSYQLSNDSYIGTRDSSRFNLTGTLSPIPRSTYHPFVSDNGRENSPYSDENNLTNNKGLVGKYTSTPLAPWKESPSNGGLGLFTPSRSPRKKTMPIHAQNHTLSRVKDTVFSPEGSPWGTSISPKMRAKAGGVKTVQTIAGPLLASTRCNIDPKVYADVTSPGLSTRLTKYATEANNKLTHQSQYATGQFPKVNLNMSPIPLITTKFTKMKTPVTVKIAPPDASRYSPPEKQKILSEICHLENRATVPGVVKVLREISLKRHASREDITSELIKKQRTDGTFNNDLETLEEMTQKRPRDDSSKSEEDISPQKRILRPTKRTKIPSCYDVLNSFSSSIHVPSGVKRKAMDSSRSGTPDHEKHFKLSDSIQTVSLPVLPQPQIEIPIPNKRGFYEELSSDTNVLNPCKKIQNRHIPPKGILKSTSSKESIANQDPVEPEEKHVNKRDTKLHVIEKESILTNTPENLTDKLFMRAEPESNEKLKTLIQEQGNIKAKFTMEDAEEIRKEDIVNMRQTSMRARLQSMFDAISGKAASEINPNVVIQAEEIKTPTSVAASPTILATLNSSTSTTNVNTSPIATSAIVPNIIKSKSNVAPTKHVTFTLANTESSQKSNDSTNISTVGSKVENFASTKDEAKLNLAVTTSSTSPTVTSNSPSSLSSFTASKSNTATPSFSFGSVSSSTTASSLPNTTLTFGTPTVSTAIPLPSNVVSTSRTQPVIQAAANVTSSSAPICTNSISSVTTSSSNNFVYDLSKTAEKSATKAPIPSNFSFGSVTTVTASTLINTQTTTSSSTQKLTMTGSPSLGIPSTVPTTSSVGSLDSVTSSVKASTLNVTSTSNLAATTTSSLFSFGTNIATPQTSKSEGFSFGSSTTTVQKAPTFQTITTTVQPISLFGSTTTMTRFAFPTSNSTPITTTAPSFNTNANTTTVAKFGSPVTTSSSLFGTTSSVLPTSADKSGFSFGTNTIATTTNASNSTISFGTTSSNSTPAFGTATSNATSTFVATSNNATPTFGTTGSKATPAFGATGSNAITTFGVPSTTAVQSFGVTTTAPMFSGTTSAHLFGTANNQSAFGGTPSQDTAANIFRTPNTTAPPAFGSSTGTTAFGGTGTMPSLFSGASTNVNTAAAPATALTFGGSNNIFSQTKSPPAFGTTTPAFGGTPNVVSSMFGTQATTTTSAFESANSVITTVAPTFGTPNSTTLAFGVQSTGSSIAGAQSTSTPVFGSPNTMFGVVTTPPAFGTTNTATAGFASPATNTFGVQNTAAPAFGASNNNTPGFGSNITSLFAAQNNPSTFGTPSSTAPIFGAPSSSNNVNNNAFTFGGNQTQSPSFSFGGSSATNPAGNVASFQFRSAPPKPDGFNFNAPSSTPSINFGASSAPSFVASTPGTNAFSVSATGGMFSIGTGSTAPRSRASRQKKQR